MKLLYKLTAAAMPGQKYRAGSAGHPELGSGSAAGRRYAVNLKSFLSFWRFTAIMTEISEFYSVVLVCKNVIKIYKEVENCR